MRIYITIIFLLLINFADAQKIFPIDGVEETLQFLKEKGVKFVTSSKNRKKSKRYFSCL